MKTQGQKNLRFKLITFIVITAFFCQNIAWAGGVNHLAPGNRTPGNGTDELYKRLELYTIYKILSGARISQERRESVLQKWGRLRERYLNPKDIGKRPKDTCLEAYFSAAIGELRNIEQDKDYKSLHKRSFQKGVKLIKTKTLRQRVKGKFSPPNLKRKRRTRFDQNRIGAILAGMAWQIAQETGNMEDAYTYLRLLYEGCDFIDAELVARIEAIYRDTEPAVSDPQRNFWNKKVKSGLEKERLEDRRYINTVLENTPHKTSRILTLGEGPFTIDIEPILGAGHKVTATDFSDKAVDVLKRKKKELKLDNLEVKRLDYRNDFELPENEYDMVISRLAIGNYDSDAEFREILLRIKKVLKKNKKSRIVFQLKSVKDATYGIGREIAEDFFVKKDNVLKDLDHYTHFWKEEKLRNLLNECGFKIRTIDEYDKQLYKNLGIFSLMTVVAELDNPQILEIPHTASSYSKVQTKTISEAAKLIETEVNRTSLKYASNLSELLSKNIWLKLETEQPTGSFKIRGTVAKMLKFKEELGDDFSKTTFITSSTGNRGLALAYCGSKFSAKVIIYVPEGTPEAKINAIKKYGAEVRILGRTVEDSKEAAIREGEKEGHIFITSHNDPLVVSSYGTIGQEITEQMEEQGKTPDAIIGPVGGGGLVSGIAAYIKDSKYRESKVIGVEPEEASAMYRSLQKGEIVTLDSVNTIAEGTALRKPTEMSFEMFKALVDATTTVSEESIKRAMYLLKEKENVTSEGAGALALAVLLSQNAYFDDLENIVLVISGGNISEDTLDEIIAEEQKVDDPLLDGNLIVLPDVHGNSAIVDHVLGKHPSSKIIFNGDVIGIDITAAEKVFLDGGLIDQGKAVGILGNHEIAFLDVVLGKGVFFDEWYKNYHGKEILQGINANETIIQLCEAEKWKEALEKVQQTERLKLLAKAMTKKGKVYHVEQETVFIHAGFTKMPYYRKEGKEWKRYYSIKALNKMQEDLRSGALRYANVRDKFFNESPQTEQTKLITSRLNKLGAKRIVFGHLHEGLKIIGEKIIILGEPTNQGEFLVVKERKHSYVDEHGKEASLYTNEKNTKKGHPKYAFANMPDEIESFSLKEYCDNTSMPYSTARMDFVLLEKLGLVVIKRKGPGKPLEIRSAVPPYLTDGILEILSSYSNYRDIEHIASTLLEYMIKAEVKILQKPEERARPLDEKEKEEMDKDVEELLERINDAQRNFDEDSAEDYKKSMELLDWYMNEYPKEENTLKQLGGETIQEIFSSAGNSFGGKQFRYKDIRFLPRTNGRLIIIGDTHGDSISTEYALQESGFYEDMAEGKDTKIVFLGDYSHNGLNSAGNLITVLSLKKKYPDNVILLSGNHDREEPLSGKSSVLEWRYSTIWDYIRNSKFINQQIRRFGKLKSYNHPRIELMERFGAIRGIELYNKLTALADSLPLACFTENGAMMSHSIGLPEQQPASLLEALANAKEEEESQWYYQWRDESDTLHSRLVNNREITPEIIKIFKSIGVNVFVCGHTHYRSGDIDIIEGNTEDLVTICSSDMYSPEAGHVVFKEMYVASKKETGHNKQGDRHKEGRKGEAVPCYVTFNLSKEEIANISFENVNRFSLISPFAIFKLLCQQEEPVGINILLEKLDVSKERLNKLGLLPLIRSGIVQKTGRGRNTKYSVVPRLKDKGKEDIQNKPQISTKDSITEKEEPPPGSPANFFTILTDPENIGKEVSIAKLNKETGIGADTIARDMRILIKAGLVERIGKWENATFRLTPELLASPEKIEIAQRILDEEYVKGEIAYRTKTRPERLRIVMRLINEVWGKSLDEKGNERIRKTRDEALVEVYELVGGFIEKLAENTPPAEISRFKPGIVIGEVDEIAIERGIDLIMKKVVPRITTPGTELFKTIEIALNKIKQHPKLAKLTRLQYLGLLNKAIRLISGVNKPFEQHNVKIDKEVEEKIYSAFREKIFGVCENFESGLTGQVKRAIREAAKLAIMGNIFDSILMESKLETFEKLQKNMAIKMDELDKFIDKLSENPGGKIVYVLDNHGEVILDKIFIELLLRLGYSVTVIAKQDPAFDDVTVDEARDIFSGDKYLRKYYGDKLKVISNESITQGLDFTQINEASTLWQEWSAAFCYIAKGGANVHTLLVSPYVNKCGLHLQCLKGTSDTKIVNIELKRRSGTYLKLERNPHHSVMLFRNSWQKTVTERFMDTVKKGGRENLQKTILALDTDIGNMSQFEIDELLRQIWEVCSLWGDIEFVNAKGSLLNSRIKDAIGNLNNRGIKNENIDVVVVTNKGKKKFSKLDKLHHGIKVKITRVDDNDLKNTRSYVPVLELLTFSLWINDDEISAAELEKLYNEITRGRKLTEELIEQIREGTFPIPLPKTEKIPVDFYKTPAGILSAA